MILRFIVGRAGSGKTHYCLEAIRGRLRESAAFGPRLLLLVPEQASFQMEQALVGTPDLAGYTRCEVLSFQRLAYRVFSQAGLGPRMGDQTLGKLGRLMLLRRLVQRHQGLEWLGRVADRPGLIKQIAATLDELMRENIEPALLDQLADQLVQEDPLGSARMRDVRKIYESYLGSLGPDRVDPARYLALAAERLPHSDWLKGAEVWVDGFAGFTAQERRLLVELGRMCRRMEIALLMDPRAAESSRAPMSGRYSLFTRTERTLSQLRKCFREAGLKEETPLCLPLSSSASLPRYRSAALAVLERGLFADDEPAVAADLVGVDLRAFPDRRAEVAAVIDRIQELTQRANEPLRYRDIAVIVRDLSVYEDLLRAEMKVRGIPCFIDHRQPTSHHPLVELVRGLLAMAMDDARLGSVRPTLKTGLLPVESASVDLLENYLLAHGIEGWSRWSEQWNQTRIFQRRPADGSLRPHQQEYLRRVNEVRQAMVAALGDWMKLAADRQPHTGRDWAAGLFTCLERNHVAGRLQEWAAADQADGRTDEAQIHHQVWVDFLELLDEFVHALGDEVMDVAGFRQTLESGLVEFDLGLAPPTLDQVLVGGIERSRQPELRAAFVLGFDVKHYPRRRGEDPLLGNAEREALEDRGLSIGPSRRRQLLEERMLVYILLTRASEYLWISYPHRESDGKPCEPSPFLADLRRALPGLTVRECEDPRLSLNPAGINGVHDLGERLAAALRHRPPLAEERDRSLRALWNDIYEACRYRKEWERTLRRALAGLAYENRPSVDAGLAASLNGDPPVFNVSQLELHAACPFAHFVKHWLRLEPRVEAALTASDIGKFCHAVLEKFIDTLAREERRLAELSDDEIDEQVDAAAREVLPRMDGELLLLDPRHAYAVRWGRGQMRRISRWQRDSAKAGLFRPAAVEFPFGEPGDSNRLFILKTPKGRTVCICGRIDRVDILDQGEAMLGVVIDYKTTHDLNKRLKMTEVYHGLSLQLVAYLLALQQTGQSLTGRPITPIAAFYLPLLERYQKVDHPGTERKQKVRWNGVIDARHARHLDMNVAPGEFSEYYHLRFTDKNQPDKRTDLATDHQWESLLMHVSRRMGELADRIIEGDVGVAPYRVNTRMPCGFCSYRAVCRYEIETQPPRSLPSLSKREVYESMGMGGGRLAAADAPAPPGR